MPSENVGIVERAPSLDFSDTEKVLMLYFNLKMADRHFQPFSSKFLTGFERPRLTNDQFLENQLTKFWVQTKLTFL